MSDGAPIEMFGSFAQALFTLGKISELQGKINNVIRDSKIPWSETRKLLKSTKVSEATNTPLFQYMRMVFEHIGLGTLSISTIDKFKINFIVDNCVICRLFPNVKNNVKNRKTCMITADALSQFFCVDMEIENETSEVRCANNGEGACEFQVKMQPLGCYQIIFDDVSNMLLKLLVERGKDEVGDIEEITGEICREHGLEDEEALFKVRELREYMLLDENYSITNLGETYYKYINSPLVKKEKKIDPPWLNLKIISNNIADSASFASAFSKSASKMKDLEER